ncbi:FGGY family carbohydrate kinase [Aestuariivirga sp.]|uniref:FGGY family carbohydrate kinase n=1 Tax=Aestuariivirga sp. TaxID=2650926 RepID=UPI00391CB51C
MKALGIDQGTTGTKSVILGEDGTLAAGASFEHRQIYPRPGWVEHDPEELFAHVAGAIAAAPGAGCIGLDNQGETVIAWDAATGRPIHNAIVWQDDRTRGFTEKLKADGSEDLTLRIAGLPLDPYFSASKLRWLLDNVAEARGLLRQRRLRLGTSDAFFLARLTGRFSTDVTTASRTSLMSLDSLSWDPGLCELFGVPVECLPEIRPSAGEFGEAGGVPVTASLVDQQAALFGHGCARPGDAKITFGTGAFALALTGGQRLDGSRFGILPTLAWKLGDGPAVFAVEGGVYNAASAVNWARQLGLFSGFGEIDGFASRPAILRELAFVPALSGLGCPHWDRSAAGLWIGLGLDTTRQDMMQSMLEGIALRAAEVVAAMAELAPLGATISVDGGMSRNAYFLSFLANVLERRVIVPSTGELTGLGAARMAMLGLAGAEERLPPLPAPRTAIEPTAGWGKAARSRFAEALRRAKGWKEAGP